MQYHYSTVVLSLLYERQRPSTGPKHFKVTENRLKVCTLYHPEITYNISTTVRGILVGEGIKLTLKNLFPDPR